jgi:hypothetical protein
MSQGGVPFCICRQPAVQRQSQKTGGYYWACPLVGRKCLDSYNYLNKGGSTNPQNPNPTFTAPPQTSQNSWNQPPQFIVQPPPQLSYNHISDPQFQELKQMLQSLDSKLEILLEGPK